MEKRLRSSLKTSADDFLSSVAILGLRSTKPTLKTLIHSLSLSSSSSSLPLSLLHAVSNSISSAAAVSPTSTPPPKRRRRSDKNSHPLQNHPQNLQVYTYISLLCISHPKKIFPASDLLPVVKQLHDNLIVFESDSCLCSDIVSLCEEWWKGGLLERETLITQSLPYLLSRSLTLKKKTDVHRVYAIREAFTLFDFEDESIEDLKLLLMRCVISPLYLKTEEGKKFVAFVIGLSGEVAREGFAMIRSQVVFGRKSTLEAYADVVFRAWKGSEGKMRSEIEDRFLQGMMEGAIHAKESSLACSIRRVLGGFFSQRTVEGVEKVLFRLAEPLIFRSLQVANSNVRQNALHLLVDMFPLEDPDCTKEAKDTLHEKQFFLLEKLLIDECPDVRVVAVEGSCRILNLFWEIIPSPTITKMITKVFDDMGHDTSSDVRLSTLSGITYLLGNPQSHEVLKVLLPRLGHLINDSASSVRGAILDLLLLIRDIRSFQFHKVVNMDALLSALAHDQPPIAQKITKLLMPSYFPSKVTPDEACNRCITLIKRSPKTGARFCEFTLSEGAPLDFLLELLKALINLALRPINLLGEQIDGLIIAAGYTCNHVANEENYKDTLKKFFSGEKLRCLFLAATSGQAQSSVCNIIFSISPVCVDRVFEKCMGFITSCTNLPENAEKQAEVRSVHKMMLSCNCFDEMYDSMTELLLKAVRGCHSKFGTDILRESSSAKQRTLKSSIKKRKSHITAASFEKDYSLALGITWQLKDLLMDESTRKAMLGSQRLDITLRALKVISEVSIVHSRCCDYMHASPILAYTGLTLHMSLQNVVTHDVSKRKSKKRNIDSAGTSIEPNSVDQTFDHLFDCSKKLFESDDCGNFCQFSSRKKWNKANQSRQKTEHVEDTPCPSDAGSDLTKGKRISNTIKILCAVLKFIIDAYATGLVNQSQGKCLKFTLKYLKFVTTNLSQRSFDKEQLEGEDLRETFMCLTSCSTYAAKLLNLILANSGENLSFPTKAHNLANSLLDLIASVELYMGTGYATRIITAIKPWLPDMILALGSKFFRKQNKVEIYSEIQSTSIFPLWAISLAKIEIQERNEVSSDEDGDQIDKPVQFPAFKKLMEMLVLFLRGNSEVLDAVGVVFFTSTVVGLERKDFEVVWGMIHFICGKLIRGEEREWEELKSTLAFLRDLYPKMQKIAELSENDGERQLLQSALLLLEPIWTTCSREDPMEEQEQSYSCN